MGLVLSLLLSGCLSIFPGVYRIDIPQGNLVDESKLAEVETGMEPRQVRYLLGTPLVTDTFDQNRWDYFYSLRNGNKVDVVHHVSIIFEQGRVVEIKDQLKPTDN
ncbi:MAG: outer membrane protein assembly factor BamE [Pseudomonadota bacterium]